MECRLFGTKPLPDLNWTQFKLCAIETNIRELLNRNTPLHHLFYFFFIYHMGFISLPQFLASFLSSYSDENKLPWRSSSVVRQWFVPIWRQLLPLILPNSRLFGNVSDNNWCRLGASHLWHAACWKHAVMAWSTQGVQYPIEQHLVATCGCLLDGSQGFLDDHQQKAAVFNARVPIDIDELIIFLSHKWACIKLLYELLKEPLYIWVLRNGVYIYHIYRALLLCGLETLLPICFQVILLVQRLYHVTTPTILNNVGKWNDWISDEHHFVDDTFECIFVNENIFSISRNC